MFLPFFWLLCVTLLLSKLQWLVSTFFLCLDTEEETVALQPGHTVTQMPIGSAQDCTDKTVETPTKSLGLNADKIPSAAGRDPCAKSSRNRPLARWVWEQQPAQVYTAPITFISRHTTKKRNRSIFIVKIRGMSRSDFPSHHLALFHHHGAEEAIKTCSCE